LIIDNYDKNIDENLFYSILNQSKQLDIYIVINSILPLEEMSHKLIDLKSRTESFLSLGIELPTDDLLRVIISKSFSDRQLSISPKVSEFIIKNIERSYEKVFKFIKEIDDLSLSSGKSININLIKKVLINE
jgi:chromosomal replication initiation ATPase DnaA